MKKIIALLAFVLVVASCERNENLTFDANGGQTLINFAQSSASLMIVIDATGTLTVPINVTTMSSSDRTFNVNIVASETTADPNSFAFNSTVTIPAGSFNGELVINGTDVNVETTAETLVLEFDTSSPDVVSDGPLTVDVFQICPIPMTTFVGDYRVTTVAPGVFGASTYGGDGNVVTLSIGESGTQRVFTANYFEDGRFPREFQLNFVCNEVVTPFQDHAVGCGGNDVNLNTGPAAVNGVYNPGDDSSFTVNVTDNFDGDCGGSPVQASYIFTKL